jgi:hypothetical protein
MSVGLDLMPLGDPLPNDEDRQQVIDPEKVIEALLVQRDEAIRDRDRFLLALLGRVDKRDHALRVQATERRMRAEGFTDDEIAEARELVQQLAPSRGSERRALPGGVWQSVATLVAVAHRRRSRASAVALMLAALDFDHLVEEPLNQAEQAAMRWLVAEAHLLADEVQRDARMGDERDVMLLEAMEAARDAGTRIVFLRNKRGDLVGSRQEPIEP